LVQEVLLLLKGIKKYGNDWFKIEEHVGTCISQQGICKFLELPIKDSGLCTKEDILGVGGIVFKQATILLTVSETVRGPRIHNGSLRQCQHSQKANYSLLALDKKNLLESSLH